MVGAAELRSNGEVDGVRGNLLLAARKPEIPNADLQPRSEVLLDRRAQHVLPDTDTKRDSRAFLERFLAQKRV